MKTYAILSSLFIGLSALFVPSATKEQTQERSLLKLYHQSVSLDEMDKKDKAITYLGYFQFPQQANADKLRLYYKGRIVEVEKGAFSLTEQKKVQVFTIVAALLPPPTSNTIATIEVPKGVTYTSYTLLRKNAPSQEDKKCEEWHVEKETGSNGYTIPSDALIILVDPALIEDTKIHAWYKDSFTLKLPTLVFAKDYDTKEFNKAYNRSLLTALDWDHFHEREKWELQKHKQSHTARKKLT